VPNDFKTTQDFPQTRSQHHRSSNINSILPEVTGPNILFLLSLQKGRRRQELVFSEAHKAQQFENPHPTSEVCGAAGDPHTAISRRLFSL